MCLHQIHFTSNVVNIVLNPKLTYSRMSSTHMYLWKGHMVMWKSSSAPQCSRYPHECCSIAHMSWRQPLFGLDVNDCGSRMGGNFLGLVKHHDYRITLQQCHEVPNVKANCKFLNPLRPLYGLSSLRCSLYRANMSWLLVYLYIYLCACAELPSLLYCIWTFTFHVMSSIWIFSCCVFYRDIFNRVVTNVVSKAVNTKSFKISKTRCQTNKYNII